MACLRVYITLLTALMCKQISNALQTEYIQRIFFLSYRFGNHYIYEPLNWEKPLTAAALLIVTTLFGLILQFLVFCGYQARIFMCKRLIWTEMTKAAVDFEQNGGKKLSADIETVVKSNDEI